MKLQIAIDCADPHTQADFWAAALGGEVQDVEPIVAGALAAGFASDADVTTHGGRRVWKDASAVLHADPAVPRVFLQRVPEPKAAKNRLHLDLQVGEEQRAAEVARLEGLGARKLYDGRLGPQTWVTMADPEGNEFCVS